MQPSDRIAFAAVLNGLAAVKPNAKITPEALDVWWQSFQAWTIEEFRAAAVELVRTVEFMPNPYHFEQLRRASAETLGESWARALKHAAALPVSGGFLQNRSSGDARLDAAAAAVGGWKAIASASADSLQFVERRFCQHLEDLVDAGEARDAVPGLADQSRRRGLTTAAKLLAGARLPR